MSGLITRTHELIAISPGIPRFYGPARILLEYLEATRLLETGRPVEMGCGGVCCPEE